MMPAQALIRGIMEGVRHVLITREPIAAVLHDAF